MIPPEPPTHDAILGENFPATHWTVVFAAGRKSHPGFDGALAAVCTQYWFPLYAFVRRKGLSREEAEDLTQGFFAVLLEKNYLGAVDPQRGRFRTFLLSSCEHFLCNEWAKQRTLKRGGQVSFVSLEGAEDRYLQEPVGETTAEKVYERSWALGMLDIALAMLRGEFTKAGKANHFDVLGAFLSGEKQSLSYADAASRLHMTEGAVRVAVHRLRTRYGELLRQAIAETLADPRDVDEELRHLLSVLR